MTALAINIGRALLDANKAHVLNQGREMNFRELGQVAADAAEQFFTGLACHECGASPAASAGAEIIETLYEALDYLLTHGELAADAYDKADLALARARGEQVRA